MLPREQKKERKNVPPGEPIGETVGVLLVPDPKLPSDLPRPTLLLFFFYLLSFPIVAAHYDCFSKLLTEVLQQRARPL